MGIVTDLQRLATKTVVATLGANDEFGVWTSLSAPFDLVHCHIEMGNKRVVDNGGNEVTSRGSVFSLEDNSLFAGANASRQSYRFTLPSSWPEPRVELVPIDVLRNEDHEGEVYEEIVL